MPDFSLTDEAGRLAALDRLCILDTPPEAAFDKITSLARLVLDVPICAVSLISSDRQWFKSIQGLAATETTRDIAFCNHTIATREPLVVPDATLDERFATNPLVTDAPGIRSYAGVQLRSPDNYNLGALCAIDTKPRDFNSAQIDILRNLAALVVDELELRMIARSDFLTGALTRRAFVKAATDEIERATRYRRPSSMIIFDIDHFKKVNDRLGHSVGDQVLKAVAGSALRAARPSDIFGRLGGEEFAVILPETSLDQAYGVAEQLREDISHLEYDAAADLRITASFGVAALHAHQTLERWMETADAALYRAKNSGRNRSVACRDES